MKQQLPDKQKKILDFIRSQHVRTGVFPSVREIAAYMEFKSTNTVDYHLRRLVESGSLQRGGRRARSFVVTGMPLGGGESSRSGSAQRVPDGVPILGRVAAGAPIVADQNFDGMVNFKAFFHCDDQTFALRVRGDSMIEAGIVDGDLVIVRSQGEVSNGEIAVALLNDEATVKRLFDEGSHWRLQPENAALDPMLVPKEETQFRVAGKVIGVVRKI